MKTMRPDLEPHDRQILEVTVQLCQQLGIYSYNPIFVSWELEDSRSGSSRRGGLPVLFRADDCLIEHYCVTLSERMKTILEPNEWKPIVASSLIYTKKLRWKLASRIILVAALLAGIEAFLFLWLPTILPELQTVTKSGNSQTAPVGYYLAFTLAPILFFIGTALFSVRYATKLRIRADAMAADQVGKQLFIQILNKIKEATHGETASGRGSMSRLPDIQTRIKNLEHSSPG